MIQSHKIHFNHPFLCIFDRLGISKWITSLYDVIKIISLFFFWTESSGIKSFLIQFILFNIYFLSLSLSVFFENDHFNSIKIHIRRNYLWIFFIGTKYKRSVCMYYFWSLKQKPIRKIKSVCLHLHWLLWLKCSNYFIRN